MFLRGLNAGLILRASGNMADSPLLDPIFGLALAYAIELEEAKNYTEAAKQYKIAAELMQELYAKDPTRLDSALQVASRDLQLPEWTGSRPAQQIMEVAELLKDCANGVDFAEYGSTSSSVQSFG
jgi:hypothetical protein